MKVALSTLGKFHSFDLARELHAAGMLQAIFTSYPKFKLHDERIPADRLMSFPWIHVPYMAMNKWGVAGPLSNRVMEYLGKRALDRYVASRLPDCDVFVGLSGSGLESGRRARRLGARYVCDRGSAHIRVQNDLLLAEHDRWGMPFAGIDPRVMDLECAEYEEADCITVPSQFALRTFLERGIPFQKLRLLPYGTHLQRFHQVGAPNPMRFDVLFVGDMSLQKGVPYLLQAFRRLEHPHKRLHFVGTPSSALMDQMKQHQLWSDDIRVWGHMPQSELKRIMSISHVLVLPSIQEGFGMVMAQALACGCPVIASRSSGAPDLYEHGREGYITAERDVDAIASHLQMLADQPQVRMAMSLRARTRVVQIGGWRQYGERAQQIYRELLA